jgi:hypothetical protein
VGNFIAEHGAEAACTKDAVEKVKMLGEFMEAFDKEKMARVMSLDQLTTSLIQFATTLSVETQPQLTITAIDLYCLLYHRFLSKSEEISVEFIVN